MTLLDHARQQERDEAANAHEKDAKHGLLVQKKPPSYPQNGLKFAIAGTGAMGLEHLSRRRARRRSNEEEVDESRGRGRLGEADALRAARALGRHWRRGGRGPMDRVLDGFVVDDGEAFLRSPRVPFSPTQRPKYVSKQIWEDFDRALGLGAMNQNL